MKERHLNAWTPRIGARAALLSWRSFWVRISVFPALILAGIGFGVVHGSVRAIFFVLPLSVAIAWTFLRVRLSHTVSEYLHISVRWPQGTPPINGIVTEPFDQWIKTHVPDRSADDVP